MDPVAEIKEAVASYAARSVEQRSHWYSPSAEAYAATRPRYPQELVAAVVAQAGLTAASTLLEVGCGPGTATVAFAELGCRIVALEPNQEFCRLARKACEAFEGVELLTTSLEEWDVQPERFDAVVAATSFHWIPPEIGYPKAARALKPNGWLILLWNKELQPPVETHEALRTILRRHAPRLDRPYEGPPEKRRRCLTDNSGESPPACRLILRRQQADHSAPPHGSCRLLYGPEEAVANRPKGQKEAPEACRGS